MDLLGIASLGYVDGPEPTCPLHIRPVDGSGHQVVGSFVHSWAGQHGAQNTVRHKNASTALTDDFEADMFFS